MIAKRGTQTEASKAMRSPWRAGVVTAVAVLALSTQIPPVLAEDISDPAHNIAEKFSRAVEGAAPQKPATKTSDPEADARAQAERREGERQRAYEEEMLARARAEAEARLKADMARAQESARQRASAEAAARKAQAEAIEKQRALEKAQADKAARKQEDAERAAEAARERAEAERLAAQREHEARQLGERLRAARRTREDERARAAAEAEDKAMADAAARLERARKSLYLRKERTAGRLAVIKAERPRHQLANTPGAPDNTTSGVSPITTGATSPDDAGADPVPRAKGGTPDRAAALHHATVLLVMTPGKRGIRRWKKSADPMLCVEASCYISKGAGMAAKRISRRKGFGPSIALGTRAGACNNQLACVFRNVNLNGDIAWMQPVDLRILRHDRREARRVSADPTCALIGKRISCSRVVESKDYRAWIIPEPIARAAGANAIEQALRNDLSTDRIARSPRR